MSLNIGILKEDPSRERRVGLSPAGVQALVGEGCAIFVEQGAGDSSHFLDEEYQKVGARTVYTRDEVFGRSDIVLKISSPGEADVRNLRPGQVLFSFVHLGTARSSIIAEILGRKITTIGYELIQDEKGELPILMTMSEIAGQLCTQIAARLLGNVNHGRGIIMGGVTGIPPATVLILGAGNVGRSAARMALASGAEVIVLDRDLSRLRTVASDTDHRVVTGLVNEYNLRKSVRFADVVIGAILIKGEKTPHIVTEEMVRGMKPGSVIMDISIDQGGCVETSRPTTLENPTYLLHNVIHYCVPNIPAMVARSATYGLTNALLPYLLEMARSGIETAIGRNRGLASGVYTHDGLCTNPAIARRFELEAGTIGSGGSGTIGSRLN
ncbi:MAG TPA: alanine dehydrogenase [Bacteroidota bacterium]|nr:alanine dehydrogenase [Bacteroidota bacterium]